MGTFVEHDSTNAVFVQQLAILGTVLPLTTIALGLRIWTRARITRNFDKSDVGLIMTHVINVVASTIWLVIQRQERNYAPRSPELFGHLSTPFLAAFGLHVVSGALVKCVIASFFLKIAIYPWQRILILTPVYAYLMTMSVGMFMLLFRCGVPISTVRIMSDVTCSLDSLAVKRVSIAVVTMNCICDLIFAAVPLHMLYSAKGLSRSSRLSAGCVIGLAIFGSVVSVVRVPYFGQLSFSPGFFEHCNTAYILAVVETTVAVMAISLAMVKPLGRVIKTRLSGISESGPVSHEPDVDIEVGQKSTVRIDTRALQNIGILPNTFLGTITERDGGQGYTLETRT